MTEQLRSVELRRQLSQHVVDAYAQALVLALREGKTRTQQRLALAAYRHVYDYGHGAHCLELRGGEGAFSKISTTPLPAERQAIFTKSTQLKFIDKASTNRNKDN